MSISEFIIKCPNCYGQISLPHHYGNSAISSLEVRCPHCKAKISLRSLEGHPVEIKTIDVPRYYLQLTKNLPIDIKMDIIEAADCFNAGCHKATVVLCRRAIQSAAINLGETRGNLIAQLEKLRNKNKITNAVWHSASAIRCFGNYGAHPQDDLLNHVGAEESEMILKITEKILLQIYS
jgi:phage FluMu protein Com